MHRTPLYLAITLAGLASLPLVASAQDADEPRKDDIELEGVVVTGSRIPRATIEGPAPVTVVTAPLQEGIVILAFLALGRLRERGAG